MAGGRVCSLSAARQGPAFYARNTLPPAPQPPTTHLLLQDFKLLAQAARLAPTSRRLQAVERVIQLLQQRRLPPAVAEASQRLGAGGGCWCWARAAPALLQGRPQRRAPAATPAASPPSSSSSSAACL